jgi:hypothetical protein
MRLVAFRTMLGNGDGFAVTSRRERSSHSRSNVADSCRRGGPASNGQPRTSPGNDTHQSTTENQEETDRYWNAIVGNGGTESQCGWCKDRWGLSWQITPRALTDALAAGGGEARTNA